MTDEDHIAYIVHGDKDYLSFSPPMGSSVTPLYTSDDIKDAVLKERKRCAKICKELAEKSERLAEEYEALHDPESASYMDFITDIARGCEEKIREGK